MDTNSIITESVAAFKQTLEAVCERAAGQPLSADNFSEFIGGMSEAISRGALAGLKVYLESQDACAAWIMREDVKYRFKTEGRKELMTPFGVLKLTRSVYQADSGGPIVVPLDESAGIRGLSATREVREAALFGAAHSTPDEVAQMMAKMALFRPSPTAIKNMVNDAGSLFEEQFEPLMGEVRDGEVAPSGARVMVASLDGANVLLDEPGPQKGRPAERPGIEPSNKSSYRNAMVGSISVYGDVPEGTDSPERLFSRYVAHMPEDGFPTFKERFLRELDHHERLLGPDVEKVLLCDGQRSIWTFAKGIERFASYEWLLDFQHTCEHLSLAAEAIFGKGNDTAKAWYRKWRGRLLDRDNAPMGLLRSMNRYAKARMPKQRREQLRTQITFFQRNHPSMRYAEFRRRGLPIGSGPVEAACKSLVKQRLCRSGMRWSRKGGQHVLLLRTAVKSRRWEALWPLLSRSQERAHAA